MIFRDNDFEVFIDPDGDTHAYYELEVNALGTPWDLMLIKPYRDGGPAINGWDIDGLQVGVERQGHAQSRRRSRSAGGRIELALPWNGAERSGARRIGGRAAGDRWRVNFSRVEWQTDIVEGRYIKRTQPGTTNPLPEDNWVWSPQGAVNMHMPERWGYVQFSDTVAGTGTTALVEDPNERVKWALRRLYYRQRSYRAAHGTYAATLDALTARTFGSKDSTSIPPSHSTPSSYEMIAPGFGATSVHIAADGRVWVTPHY